MMTIKERYDRVFAETLAIDPSGIERWARLQFVASLGLGWSHDADGRAETELAS